MDKQAVVHLHKGILFSNLKESDIDTRNNLNVSKMHSAKWLHTESLHLHGKRQNYRTEQIRGCLGWEWVEGLTSLVKELVVVTKQTEFVKIHRL